MSSVKQWLADQWAKVLIVGVALLGLAAFLVDLLSKKNSGLQAQVENIKDQKQADVLESQINENLADATLKQKEVTSNQAALDALAAKREALPQQQNLTPDQVEKYWENN